MSRDQIFLLGKKYIYIYCHNDKKKKKNVYMMFWLLSNQVRNYFDYSKTRLHQHNY